MQDRYLIIKTMECSNTYKDEQTVTIPIHLLTRDFAVKEFEHFLDTVVFNKRIHWFANCKMANMETNPQWTKQETEVNCIECMEEIKTTQICR